MNSRAIRIGELLPESLWERIQSSPTRLLMLDYDGTLAPFHVQRMRATPAPGTIEALRGVVQDPDTYVAAISGRPLGELEQLLESLRLHLVAEHGWEERTPDGRYLRHPLPGMAGTRLGQAVRAADRWRDLIERKRCSAVLHVRGLEAAEGRRVVSECRDLWGEYAGREGIELLEIDGGLELRATQRNKGSAVRDLMARRPHSALPVYLGDDVTDEDAFAAVGEHGIAVRIGWPQRESRAPFALPSQDAVTPFLRQWSERLGSGRRVGPTP